MSLRAMARRGRQPLAANAVLYVRPGGNDNNSGLADSDGGAFATIQKAVNYAYDLMDRYGFNATIQVRGGSTYGAGATISGPMVGRGDLTIQGNLVTPSSVVIEVAGGDCFIAEEGAQVAINGFTLRTTGSGNCITSRTGANVSTTAMRWEDCPGAHQNAGSGTILWYGNHTVAGSFGSHHHVGGNQGLVTTSGGTITLEDTPAWTDYFAGASHGKIVYTAASIVGSGEGRRYLSHHNAVIAALGQSLDYLPGDEDGVCEYGGRYIGAVVHEPNRIMPYTSGDYLLPDGVVSHADTVISPGQARIVLIPVTPQFDMRAVSMGVRMQGNASAGGLARFGLYEDDGSGRPLTSGGLIKDFGTILTDTGSTGAVRATSALAAANQPRLVPGIRKWMAMAFNAVATQPTVRTVATKNAFPHPDPLAGYVVWFNNTDYSAALPSTLPALTANNAANVCPGIHLGKA